MRIPVKVFSSKILNALPNPEGITAEGQTVGECLDDLISRYPDIRAMIFDRPDHLRREVYVFINAESLHKVEMSRSLRPNDTLIIAVMVTGG
jgi:hypothetical protein